MGASLDLDADDGAPRALRRWSSQGTSAAMGALLTSPVAIVLIARPADHPRHADSPARRGAVVAPAAHLRRTHHGARSRPLHCPATRV